MGNVRTEQIKRTAKELMRRFPDRFTTNFDENKKTVEALVQGTTVKIRNQIAGYITRTCSFSRTQGEEETSESRIEGEQPD